MVEEYLWDGNCISVVVGWLDVGLLPCGYLLLSGLLMESTDLLGGWFLFRVLFSVVCW